MRLIWKKYDSQFDPIVTAVGLGLFIGGAYGMGLLSHALRRPIVWLFAALPLLAGVTGIGILFREYQLWKTR